MKIVKIPKRNGKFRTIYMPNPHEQERLDRFLSILTASSMLNQLILPCQHGFVRGRNPVTNAMAHRGFKYSLCFDLSDFFDTVTVDMVANLIQSYFTVGEMDLMFPDGSARQGLPTSPFLANLAAGPMDEEILGLQKRGRLGFNFVYTRYADDLTFSTNDSQLCASLMRSIPLIVANHKFRINHNKTKWQCASQGRRIITGIAVDNKVHPTREMRRRLRAARHQLSHGITRRNLVKLLDGKPMPPGGPRYMLHGQVEGLGEWVKCKVPNSYEEQLLQQSGRLPATPRQTPAPTQRQAVSGRRIWTDGNVSP